jgi:hypothetical protein
VEREEQQTLCSAHIVEHWLLPHGRPQHWYLQEQEHWQLSLTCLNLNGQLNKKLVWALLLELFGGRNLTRYNRCWSNDQSPFVLVITVRTAHFLCGRRKGRCGESTAAGARVNAIFLLAAFSSKASSWNKRSIFLKQVQTSRELF